MWKWGECRIEFDELAHWGIKGQKWGVRRYQNLDGSLTNEGKLRYRSSDTIFISGSSKTQDRDSEFYREDLPQPIKNEIDEGIKAGSKFIVGDAPGIDRQAQNYLNSKKYDRVEIYGPGKDVRYSANKQWKTHAIDDPDHEPGSKEWLAKKDEVMTKASTVGLAVVIEDGASATRKNVSRLMDQNKDVKVFSLNKTSNDNWIDEDVVKAEHSIKSMKKFEYKEFTKLMTPDEVSKQKKGSCHDQVMFELRELRKLGLDPKALFVMEHSGEKGGMTHSLVYFIKNNRAYWVENAWGNRSGITEYKNVDAIKNEIRKSHKTGEFGDSNKYKDLSFGDFNDKDQKPGETLQELVDHIKWDE